MASVILVTGGAQGLGEAVCRWIAPRGWTVAVADININAAGAAAVAELCVADGDEAFPVVVDLATTEGASRRNFPRMCAPTRGRLT